MGTLIYTANTSLDGFVNDASGNFDFTVPSEAVHAFINDLERDVGLYLYGRRMYDTMSYWETEPPSDEAGVAADYRQIWQGARKIVYSTTLDAVATENTTIERVFDPDAVVELVGRSDTDVSIGGAHLAAHALRARLVGEIRLFVNPAIVGDGTPALPAGLTESLELLEERRFERAVYLRYSVG